MNRKLGRKSDHRNHLIRNLATSLILFEYITTSEAKAKEVKRVLDEFIARVKSGNQAYQRQAFSFFFDKNAAFKLVNELLPRYSNRQSGFIKSYHLKNRLGDNASMVRLELVDRQVFIAEHKGAEKSIPDTDVHNKEDKKKDKVDNPPKTSSRGSDADR